MKLNTIYLFSFLCIFFGCQSTQKHVADVDCPVVKYNALLTPPLTVDEVDTPAAPIGGLAAIQRQIQYPRSALKDRIQGEVLVEFVVDELGCILNAEVLNGPDDNLNAEALRVIQNSRFEPAQADGSAVSMIMTMPISFHLR